MNPMPLEMLSPGKRREFNRRRWNELLEDAELAEIEGRVETDRHGNIVLGGIRPVWHGRLQGEIAIRLDSILKGEVLIVCPVSTGDGVKLVDVAWASPKSIRALGKEELFLTAPDICVEVETPGAERETRERMRLYFDAGAKEVWVCSRSGEMTFYIEAGKKSGRSEACPEFPQVIS